MLTRREARERFADASPGLIPGIGPKTAERLERQGIATLGALAATSGRAARASGSARGSARTCGRLARFEDDRGIETVRVAKSESRETTFDRDLRGLGQLEPVPAPPDRSSCATRSRARTSAAARSASRSASTTSRTVTRARCIAAAGERAGRRVGGRGRAAAPARPAAARCA